MSGFLQEMARGSFARLARARAALSESELLERVRQTAAPPPLALHAAGFDLIAELKLRSPAAGRLGATDEDLVGRVRSYARAGVAAVSVLTEPSRFDGCLEHLQQAAAALAPLRVPAMRKDFIVDPYQVLEARASGAGGVLVILRMLSAAQLDAILECARQAELFVLLEAFDPQDIERTHDVVRAWCGTAGAGARAPLLVGVNCRDLDSLEVVPGRLEELAPLLPPEAARVAESGVASAADAARAATARYALALVGSALMSRDDPLRLAADMLAAGRKAAAVRGIHRRSAGAPPERGA
ncbi:MAG TPA: hypothetical protein VMG11_04215 [Steroidobacteraceae bacterium]|nr:hypothetical protein [Steroidobacteraceae bacterium]